MARTVFYGFGAYIGAITGPTTVLWWPDDPARLKWDPAQQIATDLDRTPEAARSGRIAPAAVQVDDFAGWGTGGLTKIGPLFPLGQMVGACWITQQYYESLPNKPPRVPPGMMCRDYELTALVDWTPSRRFYGTYAEIQAVQGTLALVSVWNPGSSQIPNQAPAGSWWLDLAATADPISGGFTTIGVGPNDSKKGALFVDQPTMQQMALRGPKNPPALGVETYFESTSAA